MAVYTLEIPEEQEALIFDSFANYYGHPQTVTDAEGEEVPNPITNRDFTRAKVLEFIKEVVKAHLANVAAEQARQATINQIEGGINLA